MKRRMKKFFGAIVVVSGLMACNSPVEKSVTGTVYDATMNGVVVIGTGNDTVFISTTNAKDAGYTGNSFAQKDTLTVYYKVENEINTAIRWEVKPALKTDPLLGSWLKPITGIEGEDGFRLHADGTATSIHSATLVYKTWKCEDNALIMEAESIGNGTSSVVTDTMCIIKLEQDSLIVSNRKTVFRYHRGD